MEQSPTEEIHFIPTSGFLMKFTSIALPLCLAALTACDPARNAAPEPANETTPAPVKKPEIIGSSWLVEDIEAKGVIDNARTFIRFDSAEMVSGSGGVNTFGGPCTLDGDKLGFGAFRATRMAGPPAVMNQERAFFAALANVRSFKLDENDLLHFLDADGREILRLSRSDEK